MRHQEHKIFHQYQRRNFPSREVGAQVRWEPGHPVKAGRTIGMVSWVLPEVAIIDKLGLNDRVVARQGRTQDDERRMGHDRAPPDGYVSCFRPNVRFGGRPRKNERAVGPIRIRRRDSRLTEQEIRECQRRPWR
jgi:arabinofuranosyltransferase